MNAWVTLLKMAGVKLAFYQLGSEGCDRRRDVQY